MLDASAATQLDPMCVAAVIDSLGDVRSFQATFDAVGRHLSFELVSIMVYRGRGRPVLAYDTFDGTPYHQGLLNYLQFSYVLSPFYQAYLDGISPGVYRMRDLVPDEYPVSDAFKSVPAALCHAEEVNYLTDGWPAQQEELLLLVGLPDGAMAEVSFLRPQSELGISNQEIEVAADLAPFVSAVVRANWDRLNRERHQMPDAGIDAAFATFGRDALSAREAEIVRLILQGHSSVSISLRLNISITTVKSHRKNAYAKLNISTQSELMALFLKSLAA
ncbi:response regulator transcription factor [Paraburkholderia sp. BR10882]|uniref:helix-turn-helix transcriptional regulator n=1 Tax=unclassified Paraburkholderia TaxID=2615204 RepID=UPI0034CE0C2B